MVDSETPVMEDQTILIGEVEHSNLNKTILGEMTTEASKDRITMEDLETPVVLEIVVHPTVVDLDLQAVDIPVVAVVLEQEVLDNYNFK
jgi:hypothetical protein